jgi:hypothetical protein
VLSLDADERVSSALPAEIERIIVDNNHGSYRMPRSSSYCAQFMEHSDWSLDYDMRLFKRGHAQFSDD